MMKPVLLSLYSEKSIVVQLQKLINADWIDVHQHTFPDGETYLQIQGDAKQEIKGREVIIFDSLNDPNSKLLPLIFLANTVREFGAKKVGLLCPYLAYMRQDKRFLPGEAITSKYFAKLISISFDWLVTIDPHLHRYKSLDEIYTVPCTVVHSGPTIAKWVAQNIEKPFFIGPDMESKQWVSSIAQLAESPFVILEKIRKGDRDVSITFPDLSQYLDHTPVLVDDIISTARTMVQTVNHINKQQLKKPVCIGVHGIFAEDAYDSLLHAGVLKVVTCNTVSHPTNQVDVLPALSHVVIEKLTDS